MRQATHQNEHAIGELFDRGQLMTGKEHGRISLARRKHFTAQPGTRWRIKPGKGLVQ